MLNLGKFIIIVVVLYFIYGCDKKNDHHGYNLIDSSYNSELPNLVSDSIESWKMKSLLISKVIFFDDNWKIEDIIILSEDSSRSFTYLLSQNIKSDYLYDLAGAKINGKWYFFFGSSTVIDRASYQDSIYSPLTFDELSYLARENLSGAFYKDENGEVKVKESFFDFMDDKKGWGLPPGSTRKDIDSLIVAGNKEMHTYKIDPLEIEQIKADMAKSVRPKEPIPDMKWYEKIFPKKKKLFETDEWKEYVKNKNQEK
jgi:hypothetical protein